MLGATLALSACSTQEAGAAAVVDGTSIRDKDVQTVSLELGPLAQGEQKLTSSTVLLNLILSPYVLAEAGRAGKSVNDAQARKALAELAKSSGAKLASPSGPTLEFMRMQLAIQTLTDAGKQSILTKLGKAKITVNPRYGSFDPKQVAITPAADLVGKQLPGSPNWIKASPTSPAK
jgi:hypothetical protein